ncbi:mechanosensitive ion channel family protein [Aeromicrobium sp. CFBP 8757]|uniref:mechanosensitive ion channel family protein n=1 Tax=Aeromicrobium sp. CFBP 8757 TaxID=2775288 RepID=UPI00177BAD13|nr:mechanosensitive ion channel family protein [Aeromicrobium sp. CFBP 8757]MBD8605953.1 mechanosensitive ion channel family protein [Aeromicrobium sp. CFBP 8757]
MTDSWTDFLLTLGGAVAVAAVLLGVLALLIRLAARRSSSAAALHHSARLHVRALLLVVAVWVSIRSTLPGGPTNEAWEPLNLVCRIATIVAVAWLVASIALFVEDLSLRRYRIDVADNRNARRARTQVLVIRRLTLMVVVVLAIGAILLSFPGAGAIGASVLASAGVISIVAALAAQSTLGNVIAGIQIAFSDSIRYDDAVIVEGEWGWVEEITLSYVVVRLWDDRRMVLPSTYFTTTPFQNWTRNHSELLGAVEFDLDWRVSPDGMRAELDRILPLTDLWDGRVKVLQVTDAVGGFVHVRILVTARDAPTLFDLRCHVRERMIDWLQSSNEGGLPRHRVETVERVPPRRGSTVEPSGLYSGDDDADERAARLTTQTPVSDAPTERTG